MMLQQQQAYNNNNYHAPTHGSFNDPLDDDHDDAPPSYLRASYTKPPPPGANNSNNTDDLSAVGSILGAVVCFLLFCLIIASIAYPFTMYRTAPSRDHVYSDGMWWCYHCTAGGSSCASRCW